MRLRVAFAFVLASPLLASCFRPELTCLPCLKTCPGSLKCMGGYCVEIDTQISYCESLATDARSGPAPEIPPDGPVDGESGGVCTGRCCIGDRCLEFPTHLQRGLILWADRTSLPPVGHLVERWRDRSPKGNDIVNVNVGKGPKVELDDIGPIAEIEEESMVMATRPGPELRLAFDDFTILIVARCDASTQLGTLIDRIVPSEPRNGLRLFCNHDGAGVLGPDTMGSSRVYLNLIHDDLLDSFGAGQVVSVNTFEPGALRLFVARRVAGEVQVRVNGRLEGRAPIPGSLSLMAETPFFIGAIAASGPLGQTKFNGGIATVVIVRGPLAEEDLVSLEKFLMATSGPRTAGP